MKLNHPFRILAAAAGTAMAGATLIAGPAPAAPPPAPEPGAPYVALGSSYAAGAGVGPADPTDIGALCGRTLTAYPTLVAKALDLNVTNATCGGATTENITTSPQNIRTHSINPQIDAVTAETRLVTITIGGNDVNYVGNLIAESCLADLATDPSSPIANMVKQYGACTPQPDETVRNALAQMESKLTTMTKKVQAKAPQARILLVDYPAVLPQNGEPCSFIPILRDRQKFLLEVARGLNLATKHAAQATGADYIAGSQDSRHHDACSTDPWMTGYLLAPGSAPMHPNEKGQAAVADAIVKQLTTPGSAS
ncbi:SGNH/GDSL hydrolase family protein [Arthrobacter sp. AFG20]|uniref:SGNH/GDSL hydrolase family protein n=1 Tax=Arthrobacter sp. AFG20 TaxID=1688671 RepID=UPI000C9E35CB|nr:SGNH/GDSL hydrolase family protein [Arthrobacter sp. AFG20]PNH78174.1 SGNH/GDSL hydrolase family protein [Arthrobacter sp. AFG20]